jgi:general stress protein 26
MCLEHSKEGHDARSFRRMAEQTNDTDTTAIADLIEGARIAMVTTRTDEGLHARPLAIQDKRFDGSLWFLIQGTSATAAELAADPSVGVAIESKGGYLSLAGTASMPSDPARVDELWTREAEAWFPGGREDPSVTLLRIEAVSAEYWALHDPKPVALLKYAAAMVTGHQPDVGETRTTSL